MAMTADLARTALPETASPCAAQAAEAAFRRGRIALAAFIAVWTALAVLAMQWDRPLSREILIQLMGLILVAACLVLVSGYRVPFAGRLLLPLWTLISPEISVVLPWTVVYFWMLLPFAVLAGAGLGW